MSGGVESLIVQVSEFFGASRNLRRLVIVSFFVSCKLPKLCECVPHNDDMPRPYYTRSGQFCPTGILSLWCLVKCISLHLIDTTFHVPL